MKYVGHYVMIFSLLFSGLIFLACNKEKDPELDILSEQWDLSSIEFNGELIEKENRDFLRTHAYVLIFLTDSTFNFNTSANLAGGQYKISNLNGITFSSYHEFTEVGTSNEHEQKLNDRLLQELPKVYEYSIQGDNLSLITDDGKISFTVQ